MGLMRISKQLEIITHQSALVVRYYAKKDRDFKESHKLAPTETEGEMGGPGAQLQVHQSLSIGFVHCTLLRGPCIKKGITLVCNTMPCPGSSA